MLWSWGDDEPEELYREDVVNFFFQIIFNFRTEACVNNCNLLKRQPLLFTF